MTQPHPATAESLDTAHPVVTENPLDMFSIIRDDFAYKVQRRLGLMPVNGLGIVRRAIFWSLVAWLLIVFWAQV